MLISNSCPGWFVISPPTWTSFCISTRLLEGSLFSLLLCLYQHHIVQLLQTLTHGSNLPCLLFELFCCCWIFVLWYAFWNLYVLKKSLLGSMCELYIRLPYNLTSGELPSLQLWAFLSTGRLIYRQFLRWLNKVSQSCSGSCFSKK